MAERDALKAAFHEDDDQEDENLFKVAETDNIHFDIGLSEEDKYENRMLTEMIF
jgi:hypothetical protein